MVKPKLLYRIYAPVLEHQNLQISLTAPPQTPSGIYANLGIYNTAPPSHDLQCAPVFGRRYIIVLEVLLIYGTLTIETLSFHPPTPPSSRLIIYHVRPIVVLQGKTIFVPTLNRPWRKED